MGRPNAMAETNSTQITRASFRSDLQEIEDLLTVAFGPEGRAVLVQNRTGQMTITRSGFNILKAVYADNDSPSKKILFNCAEKLHEECGDGIKCFMSMTATMFKYCECLERSTRLVQQLEQLQSHLSQLRGNLESTDSTDVNATTSAEDCGNAKIIRTFFGTRFPALVSSALATFLHEWISKLSSCICLNEKRADLTQNLKFLVKNFSILCRYDTGCQSVSDSCVKEGFLLGRSALNLFKSGHRKLVILLFDDEDSTNGKFDQLDVMCEVGRLLDDIKQLKKEAEHGSNAEFLVLTPTILPELAVFRLKQENVAIIHGAPIDEVKYLFCVMTQLQKESNVGLNYWIVEVIYENGKDYTFFKIPAIYNFFLCGPTTELRAEYAQACRYALKLLIGASQITLVKPFTEGGGDFERNLHRFLTNKFDLHNNAVPRLSSRAELLQWHNEKLKNKSSAVESGSGDTSIYKMISETFSGLDKHIVEAILAGIMSVPRKLPLSKSVANKSEVIEPIALKLSILQLAVASVITLLKIDGTLYIKKHPK